MNPLTGPIPAYLVPNFEVHHNFSARFPSTDCSEQIPLKSNGEPTYCGNVHMVISSLGLWCWLPPLGLVAVVGSFGSKPCFSVAWGWSPVKTAKDDFGMAGPLAR